MVARVRVDGRESQGSPQRPDASRTQQSRFAALVSLSQPKVRRIATGRQPAQWITGRLKSEYSFDSELEISPASRRYGPRTSFVVVLQHGAELPAIGVVLCKDTQRCSDLPRLHYPRHIQAVAQKVALRLAGDRRELCDVCCATPRAGVDNRKHSDLHSAFMILAGNASVPIAVRWSTTSLA